MDWIKEHKTLSGILGVILAGFIALAVMLWGSYSAYAEALETHGNTDKKLGRLESLPLYPNKENLDAKSQLVSQYEAEVTKLQKTLLNLQPPLVEISETDFQAKLKQRMAETRQKAGANEETSRIPKNFAFGFDIYVNSLPAAGTAKDLNDYLDGVDAIVQLALDSGVKKIDSLTRSDLPSEKGGAASAPTQSSTSSFVKPAPSSSAAGRKPAAEEAPKTQVVERRQVTMKVVADQGPLQALLNGLASASKMHYFTVVRVLRIENEKMDGPSRALSVPAKTETAPPATGLGAISDPEAVEAPKPAGPEVVIAPAAAPVDAIAVMGQEQLHAYLEIDIVRYLPAGSTAAAN